MSDDGLTATVGFDTAWSPPINFFDQMRRLGFTVDAYYYEPGMGFCGHYTDGVDTSFEIPGSASEVEKAIPADINEMFAISDNMSDWEQED